MKATAPSYYEAESLAIAFIESHEGEYYAECDSNTIYVYNTNREIIFQVPPQIKSKETHKICAKN